MSQVEHHQSGIGYWRSLEQLADTPEVADLLAKEFPGYDPASMAAGGAPSRRGFLKLMGASMALAGLTLTGCRRWPEEKLVPYSSNPQGRVPGQAEFYATNWELGGVGQGLLVTSFDGRPIKIEGNPSHPFSWTVKDRKGSADAWAQASILEMYDPQRSRSFINRMTDAEGKAVERVTDWDAILARATPHFAKLKADGGKGLAILSEASDSPSVRDMRRRLEETYGKGGVKWYEYEPLSRDAELEGSRLAFGKAARSIFHLDKATVVVSLDADLLGFHPAHVRYAADWAEQRRGADPEAKAGEHDKAAERRMNRVYMAETCFTITGSVADERVAVDPGRIPAIARAIAGQLGVAGTTGGSSNLLVSPEEMEFVSQASADLQKANGTGFIAVGPSVAKEVHALAHAINAKLKAVGNVVTLIDDPAGDRPTHFDAIAALTDEINKGNVTTLLILGGNPAYDAPADLDFAGALMKVQHSVRLGLYDDETSRLCKWHLPRAHYLESWGDARAWDGSPGVTQPLIEPLFGGKSVIEVLAVVAGDTVRTGEEIVRRTWKEQVLKVAAGGDFETAFRRVLHDGVSVAGATPNAEWAVKADLPTLKVQPRPANTFFLKFEPDYHTYDGRFANNGWLQETHDPLTKLIWDNAALVAVADARRMGIDTGDVIKIQGPNNGPWIEVAAYVMPGQPLGVISLSVGYARTAAGEVGSKLGFDAYRMRSKAAPYVLSGVTVTKLGQTYKLVTTHLHHLTDETGMKGRDERIGRKGHTGKIVREATLAAYTKNPKAPHEGSEGSLTLQLFDPPRDDKFSTPHRWGMSIDMSTCIGCNACVVACQAENNIPVVGKDQAAMHREMQWIRIDRYFKTRADVEDARAAAEDPQVEVVHQPMLCVHCENAPCEQVCPVAATMHDTEGLNTMVYNRCIGTRYCSNNCPYKVRRFNYFDWHAKPPRNSTGVTFPGLPDQQQLTVDKIRQMQFNPEVTVRMRGVMEKCTYCTQRIQRTKIDKRNRGQNTLKDWDVMTACEQACPTTAIVFGDLNDKRSRVSRLQDERAHPRVYDVLGELNTRPRTKYLAKLRNPSDGEQGGGGGGEHGGHGETKHTSAVDRSNTESAGRVES